MDPYRLPRAVVPRRYDLRLEPDLTAATFTGRVVITVEVREPVSEVFLNAAELRVSAASLEGSEGRQRTAAVALDEEERCRLTFDGPLPAGEARLRLEFAGTLNDKLRGFYRSRYRDAAGQTRTLAATQFEATDARRAFPCWDEPAFKAVFSATLVIEPGLQAVSNTAVAEERVEGGKRVVRFADTIPMSTYLVAFVVGQLDATEPTLVGVTPLRVWCVPGKRRLAAFGQEIGAASLAFFEGYYGRQYPGDKLDLVAIPDFAAGAMENLGAITFRETALLVDEAAATHAERERVADVVAHENAHMWFGDVVTMEWWNGLWLNEAFATFMEMLAVDAWRPQWQRWTAFGVSRSAALTVDGLRSTRPVEYPVAAPRDAEAMFDVLTYEKGASVLRMLEQYVGPDVFRAGVRGYLERHAYQNTQTADLWQALGEASGLPIPEIMHDWVFRPGYPLLEASLSGGRLILRQRRFGYLPSAPTEEGQLWQVPVQLRVQGREGPERRRLVLAEAETHLDLPQDGGPVLVNEGGHGFYRVRYAPDLLARLLDNLPGLAPIERFNLVNDCWALVLAGRMPLADYLDLTRRFRAERDKNVWSVLVGSLQALSRIARPEDRAGLEALVRDRVGPALAGLGWRPRAGEDELTRQLRGELIRAAGTLGNDAAVQARAAEVFVAGAAGADANVFAAVIPVLAHAGDAQRYDQFLRLFRAAATPQEEQRYLLALAAFRPPELIDQTLARTLNGEVRTQDAPFLVRALLYGVESRARAWPFVQANWEQMSRDYPVTGFRRMFEGVLGLATPEWEREARAFVEQHRIDLGGKTLEQYLEQLHIAVRLREREGAALSAYLAKGS
jgi:puromycin-sensitive aminopeptidase